jgi:hypothetical protein
MESGEERQHVEQDGLLDLKAETQKEPGGEHKAEARALEAADCLQHEQKAQSSKEVEEQLRVRCQPAIRETKDDIGEPGSGADQARPVVEQETCNTAEQITGKPDREAGAERNYSTGGENSPAG